MYRLRSRLYATTCSLALIAAIPAVAQAAESADDGAYRDMTVEAGLGVVTDDSFKFGEYTGLEEDGVYAIGNVSLFYRAPFDSGSGSYWSLTGYDLGLESRDIYGEFGKQGLFGVEVFFDQTPHYFFNDAVTPFRGAGTDNLTLPGFWVPATGTAGMTELDNANRPLEFKIQRDKFGATFNLSLSDHWRMHVGAKREEKEGIDRIWGIFGTNGGNPSTAVLPEPIDWATTRIEGGIGYKTDRLQANLVYEASIFNNRNNSLTWENPFSGAFSGAAWHPAVGYPEEGRMSLHPDNQAHTVTFTGAYRFSPGTRMTTQFRYINSTQDETLLPFTVNPFLLPPIGLPRDSAEAEITNIRGDVKLVSRLTDRSTLRLSYTYDDRDNDTPRDIFVRVPNDTAIQGTLDSSLARINHPFSFREHEAEASLSYRVSNWLNLDGAYTWERIERTYQDVTDTSEHKGEIKAHLRPGGYAGGRVQGWVGASYASRSHDGRQTNRGHLTSQTPQFLAGETPDAVFGLIFENHPELQPFHTAGRDEIAVDASFTVLPSDDTSVTFYAKWADAEFDDSEPLVESTLGLREQDNLQLSVDGTYSLGQRAQIFVNYTYENFNRLVLNHQFASFGALASLVDPNQRWSQDVEDEIHTVGAGFNWKSEGGRFGLKGAYNFHLAETSWDIAVIGPVPELAFLPYPIVETRRHRVDVKADFKVTETLKTRLTYIFEDLDTADWAYEGVTQTATGRDLLSGHQPWDYGVHVIGLSAIKTF